MKDIKIYYSPDGIAYFVIWEGDKLRSFSTWSGNGGTYEISDITRNRFPEEEISVEEFFGRLHLLRRPFKEAEKVFRELGIVWWNE